jgi:hypothetical protein
MPINLPDDIAKDIRQPILGDSFGWAGLEPAAAKKSIVIHATASESPVEDGFVVAGYHVNHNGWGGCGVHFVCTKDTYPGQPRFGLPPGAHMQYVGDLLTWRAGTANQNPGRIHIEISGLFTPGHDVPSEGQLRAVRRFIDFALAKNNVLPSLNFYNQVTYHNAVPDQSTACPGWQHPQFQEWFGYLQGGPEPSWFAKPQPAPAPVDPPIPAPPSPEPVAEPTPEPGKGSGEPTGQPNADTLPVIVVPQGIRILSNDHEARTVLREGAYAVDVLNGEATMEATKPHLLKGQGVDVWQYFQFNGNQYARTEYATRHNQWTGIPLTFLQPPDVPDFLSDPELPHKLGDSFLALPAAEQETFWRLLGEAFTVLVAPLLRVLGNKNKGK